MVRTNPKNPAATSWVNERIIYTHGIGLAMVPVRLAEAGTNLRVRAPSGDVGATANSTNERGSSALAIPGLYGARQQG